jgi:hypothetical protein
MADEKLSEEDYARLGDVFSTIAHRALRAGDLDKASVYRDLARSMDPERDQREKTLQELDSDLEMGG